MAGVDFPTSGQLRTVVISATWHDFPMSEQFRAVVICVIRQCQTAKADMQLAEWQGTLHVQNVEENCWTRKILPSSRWTSQFKVEEWTEHQLVTVMVNLTVRSFNAASTSRILSLFLTLCPSTSSPIWHMKFKLVGLMPPATLQVIKESSWWVWCLLWPYKSSKNQAGQIDASHNLTLWNHQRNQAGEFDVSCSLRREATEEVS